MGSEAADKPRVGTKRASRQTPVCNIPEGDAPRGARHKASNGLSGAKKLAVFVLGGRKKPLMPCGERRAHPPLKRGSAVIHKRCRFTILIKDRVAGAVQPIRIKIDPGSEYTGFAVTRDEDGMRGSGHGLR
jgi:hypothetical protein